MIFDWSCDETDMNLPDQENAILDAERWQELVEASMADEDSETEEEDQD